MLCGSAALTEAGNRNFLGKSVKHPRLKPFNDASLQLQFAVTHSQILSCARQRSITSPDIHLLLEIGLIIWITCPPPLYFPTGGFCSITSKLT